MPIRVAIIEDDADTRASLAALLEREADIQCVGTYRSGETAVKAVPEAAPDVALVDINLPGMSGIECVGRLRAALQQLHVLMLTKYEESDLIFDSLRAGAEGYLLKKLAAAELAPAIRQVLAGGTPMSMQIARRLVEFFREQRPAEEDLATLTPREQELLELLAKGYYYRELADRLDVTMSTVRAHVHAIYSKLHVRSRSEATLKYLGRR